MANISTYLNRITSAHSDKPKFMAMVAADLQPFVDAQNLLENLWTYFDLGTPTQVLIKGGRQNDVWDTRFDDTFGPYNDVPDRYVTIYEGGGAIGAQLDIIGEWVNLSRVITVPLPDPWFRLGDIPRGLGRGIVYNPNISTGTYLSALDDEIYKRLLVARIAANKWDGTSENALDILNMFFIDPATYPIVDDKQTMWTIYALAGKIPDPRTLEIFCGGYLPLKTAGVTTDYLVTSVDGAPIFGLGVNNGIIGGLGYGAVGVPAKDMIVNNLGQ